MKSKHQIEVRIYPPFDPYGHFVYQVGKLFGVMERNRCHFTIRFIMNSGTENVISERHLTIDGVRLLYSKIGDVVLVEHQVQPTVILPFQATTAQLIMMHKRIGWYEDRPELRVTVSSLVNTLLNPQRINYSLCSSFVQYVLTGKVTVSANRNEKFIKELLWLSTIPR